MRPRTFLPLLVFLVACSSRPFDNGDGGADASGRDASDQADVTAPAPDGSIGDGAGDSGAGEHPDASVGDASDASQPPDDASVQTFACGGQTRVSPLCSGVERAARAPA